VARLVAWGFVRAIQPGHARRGRLYHVHHKPLSTKRLAKPTTATVVFARSAGWSNGRSFSKASLLRSHAPDWTAARG
jgi:hypothetical protein